MKNVVSRRMSEKEVIRGCPHLEKRCEKDVNRVISVCYGFCGLSGFCGSGGSHRDLKRCTLTTGGHEIASLPNATTNCFISTTSFVSSLFHFSYRIFLFSDSLLADRIIDYISNETQKVSTEQVTFTNNSQKVRNAMQYGSFAHTTWTVGREKIR